MPTYKSGHMPSGVASEQAPCTLASNFSTIPPIGPKFAAAADDDQIERIAQEVFGLPADKAKELLRTLAKEVTPSGS